MIIFFLALLIGLSIYDLYGLIKKRQFKDAIFYISFMILVGIMGIIYFRNEYQRSISDYLLDIFS